MYRAKLHIKSPELKRSVERAIMVIARKSMTFLPIVLKCRIVEINSSQSFYAATDGKRILINAPYAASLDHERLASVLLHEALHIALQHVSNARAKQYPGTYNIAADAVINYYLAEKLGYQLPPDVVTMDRVSATLGIPKENLKKLSADEIYYLLLKRGIEEKKTEDLSPEGIPIEGVEAEEGEEKSSEAEENEEEEEGEEGKSEEASDTPTPDDVRKAIDWATQLSNTSKIAVDPIEDTMILGLKPRIDWVRIFRNVMSELARTKKRYTWFRESRKLGADAMGRIRAHRRKNIELIVLLDVSGSVHATKDLVEFVKEVGGVARVLGAGVTLVQWADYVLRVDQYPKGRLEKLARIRIKEGMFTKPANALEKAIEIMQKSDKLYGLIMFTDGEFIVDHYLTELAREAASLAAKAVYVYTVFEHPDVFSNWFRIKYPIHG